MTQGENGEVSQRDRERDGALKGKPSKRVQIKVARTTSNIRNWTEK